MTIQLVRTVPEAEQGVARFMELAFRKKMPSLIPFVETNGSLLELTKRLKRQGCSAKTLYQYVFGVSRFTRWVGRSPDDLIAECRNAEGDPLPKILTRHAGVLEDFIGCLQDERLADGTINNHCKGVRQLYARNGLKLELGFRISKRVKYKDRSPSQTELQRVLDIADPREKTIIDLQALGGFRTGTLSQLRYSHVKRDLERGIIPVHVHVQAEITKGHYADFDTFLAIEAVEDLSRYLGERRRGSVWNGGGKAKGQRIPPEEITDDSPLIRDDYPRQVRLPTGDVAKVFGPITPGRIHDITHELYVKAGLLREKSGTRYELRAHSLRKFFKTQLIAHGVPESYADYMMGHVTDTYHDVQSLGVEFLRDKYAKSGFSIRPKGQIDRSKIMEAIGSVIDKALQPMVEPGVYPHRTNVVQNPQARQLLETLRDAIKSELASA